MGRVGGGRCSLKGFKTWLVILPIHLPSLHLAPVQSSIKWGHLGQYEYGSWHFRVYHKIDRLKLMIYSHYEIVNRKIPESRLICEEIMLTLSGLVDNSVQDQVNYFFVY